MYDFSRIKRLNCLAEQKSIFSNDNNTVPKEPQYTHNFVTNLRKTVTSASNV